MTKTIKALIAVGGTGGHVFPGCNLADHLSKNNYDVVLTTDNRGFRYLEKFKHLKIFKLPSAPINTKNILTLFFSFFFILYSILRSLLFLLFNKPSIIFGMGGYASFPICVAATILRIKFIIYENNLIVGKANKYLIPFTEKIFVSFKELEGIPQKYTKKIIEIGNIINKEIIFHQKEKFQKDDKKLKILILGGSQAAKIFAETLPKIFRDCVNQGVLLKVYQHCLPSQNHELMMFYKETQIDFEIFNFSYKLVDYFSKVDLAITRSGSSMLAELTNAKVPFISVPLPTSADNHQYKNAIYSHKKNLSLIIEEKDLNDKLPKIIGEISNDSNILKDIKRNQSQYSDKNVYENIDQELIKIINEKN